ncbi:MAG: hypothetical protein H7202_06415 [Pedobacter sp.]|nr:hypothetical protein [Pedobacter sp.]
MKKTLTFLLLVLAFQAFGQNNVVTNITISLTTNPDANTANWTTGTSLLTISANAKMENGRVTTDAEGARILVFVRKNGIRICGTFNTGTAPAAGFTTATKVWSGNQAISLIGQTCTLQPGSYELVVQFFGNKNGSSIAVSDEKTKAFTILNVEQLLQSPQNLSPTQASEFTQTALAAPMIFKWTPLTPAQNSPIKYKLKLWQLMVGQSNSQAMAANLPLVTKDVTAATQTVIPSIVSGPCMAPYRCEFIWMVQAIGEDGNPIGPNNGKSLPTTFQLAPSQTASNAVGCSTTATKNFVTGDEIGLSDNFKMQLTENPTGSNMALTGKGTVYVKWLGLLKVQFKNIKINGSNKLCEGEIYTETDPGQAYPTQWAINAMSNMNPGAWTLNKVHAVGAWIQGNKLTKPLVKATDQLNTTLTPVPLSMPIGYFKDADENTALGFTEMIFKPDHAEFEVIASLNTEKIFKDVSSFSQTDAIALQGSGIYFTPAGLSGTAGSIKLVEPLTVTYSNNGTENLKLTFNKEANGHIGNGIVFSAVSDQFWKYNLDVNVQLPKEWLVPVDPIKTNVDLNFQSEITEWNDFILQGNLPACVIPNSNGLGIQAGSITYDHSNISNAANMVFPAGYTGNTNAMFAGFYLKSFKLTLPDQLRTYADTTKKIEVIAENLIIDKDGITGKILANNVLNYPTANVGNLGASIDEVKVVLNSSTLTEAKMQGKITLPLSSADNANNAINYSALFTPSGPGTGNTQVSSIVFSLSPNQDITSKFLGDGKIQIDQTSSLSLILSKSTTNKRAIYLDIDLNGKLYYPAGNIIDVGSPVPLDLDLSCNFEHLGLHYAKSTEETFTLQVGHWSFASPQKKLSGFAFTITDVKAKIEPIGAGAEKQYLFKGGVEFVAKINIGSESSPVQISGDTKIALTGAIESAKYTAPSTTATGNAQVLNVAKAQSATLAVAGTTNVGVMTTAVKQDFGFLTQLKPKYLGVRVESIHVNATMPALTIKGSVEFYKKDPVYGNGFKGELQAKFTTLDMVIQAGAIFGNTKYIPNNVGAGFKYWKVEAQVNLPPPGIVFLTGLAFRGFGAGVYSRMNMTPPANFNPTTAAASTFGGAVFTPDATVKMGFKVKAIIATTPKEETFNGSVALAAEFNTSGGMNKIEIDGLFNLGAKIGEEAKAFANGSLNIMYDFPLKYFSTNLQVNINKDPISTPSGPINASFFIDGKKNEWAFTCGYPSENTSTLNTVRLFNLVNVSQYLMFGNKIVAPTGFLPNTVQQFAALGKQLPGFQQSATSNESKSAKGFAFGIAVSTTGEDKREIVSGKTWKAGIKADFAIGGEINASLLQYQNCQGFGDGWRIKAGIALYARLTGKGYYDGAVLDKEINLISLGFGTFVAEAEFPNPFYAEGGVVGTVEFLDLLSFDFSASFRIGNPCAGAAIITPDVVYEQENAQEELNYTLINSIVAPAGTTGVSRIPIFSVLENYPDNQEFAIEEQQSSGQINVRTFRAVYTPNLIRDSINSAASGPISVSNTLSGAKKISSSTSTQTTLGNQTTAANNSITAKKINLSAVTADPNVVSLTAGPYDAIGAKTYRLTKNGIQVKPLMANTSYKFTITGRLEEKVNNTWQAVKNPLNQLPIIRKKHIYFKTNSETVSTGLNPVKQSLAPKLSL